VQLVVETFAPEVTGLRAQIDFAAALAARYGAPGAFWLETSAGDDLLYLVDPGAARVLVRRVRSDARAPGAGSEEIAVITRATALALVEGREIGMQPVDVPRSSEPAPEPRSNDVAPSPAVPSRDRWEIGVAYLGDTFSSEVPWQSGAGVTATWSPAVHARVGAGTGFFFPADVDAGVATIRITRVPVEALGGYDAVLGPLTLGGELAAIAEYSMRSTVLVAAGLTASPDATRWDFALAARARLTWPAQAPLRLLVRAGGEALVTTGDYVLDTGQVLTSPSRLRLRTDVGVVLSF
jgi:hypothetical protein